MWVYEEMITHTHTPPELPLINTSPKIILILTYPLFWALRRHCGRWWRQEPQPYITIKTDHSFLPSLSLSLPPEATKRAWWRPLPLLSHWDGAFFTAWVQKGTHRGRIIVYPHFHYVFPRALWQSHYDKWWILSRSRDLELREKNNEVMQKKSDLASDQ